MSENSNLALSIRKVLAQWQKVHPVSQNELRALAARAKRVNEDAIEFLSNLEPVQSEKYYVAMQLVRAAFDHGRGLLFLIESNPSDMGAPALAFHRSQIENFLRGVYLGFIASDDQISDFLESDSGIREKNHNDKWQNIGITVLAERVEIFVNNLSDDPLEDKEKFSKMVANVWSPLCGFVHGGRAVQALYRDGQGQIGSDIPVEVLIQCVSNCFVITNFAFLVVIAHIYNLQGIFVETPLHRSLEQFMELQRLLRNKQLMAASSSSFNSIPPRGTS